MFGGSPKDKSLKSGSLFKLKYKKKNKQLDKILIQLKQLKYADKQQRKKNWRRSKY